MQSVLKHSRRAFVLGAFALLTIGQGVAPDGKMTATQAHQAALSGDLLLIDVRTRQEWQQTGIGASAYPLSMHEPDFMAKLDRLTGGDMSRPIGVICATGGRSSALQGILRRMRYTHVIDVSEGMLGNDSGKGWIESGLPVVPYKP